jgi:hypothetical protein
MYALGEAAERQLELLPCILQAGFITFARSPSLPAFFSFLVCAPEIIEERHPRFQEWSQKHGEAFRKAAR